MIVMIMIFGSTVESKMSLCGGACGSGQIFQHNAPMLWGVGAPLRAKVVVYLDGVATGSANVRDGTDGKAGLWEVILPKQPFGTGHNITVTVGQNKRTITNIGFGDVFLCSGQSNMCLSVDGAIDARTVDEPDADRYGDIRLLKVTLRNASTEQDSIEGYYSRWPRPAPDDKNSSWGVTRRENIPGFSAVCYFAARELYNQLGGDRPIGLVQSCVGGTRVEAWSSPDALSQCAPAAPEPNCSAYPPGVNSCSVLWNGMIAPILPMRFSAVLWYQVRSVPVHMHMQTHAHTHCTYTLHIQMHTHTHMHAYTHAHAHT